MLYVCSINVVSISSDLDVCHGRLVFGRIPVWSCKLNVFYSILSFIFCKIGKILIGHVNLRNVFFQCEGNKALLFICLSGVIVLKILLILVVAIWCLVTISKLYVALDGTAVHFCGRVFV